MRHLWKPIGFVLAAILVIVLTQIEWSAEKSSEPPHRARSVASVPQDHPPDLPRAEAYVQYVTTIERSAVGNYLTDRARVDFLASIPAPSAPVVSQAWPTSLQPRGGDLPPCYVKQRESGGDYSARNNSEPGAACGAWQIIGSTWAGFGGYTEACDAPPAVQDDKARQLWAGGGGCAHWSAC